MTSNSNGMESIEEQEHVATLRDRQEVKEHVEQECKTENDKEAKSDVELEHAEA